MTPTNDKTTIPNSDRYQLVKGCAGLVNSNIVRHFKLNPILDKNEPKQNDTETTPT